MTKKKDVTDELLPFISALSTIEQHNESLRPLAEYLVKATMHLERIERMLKYIIIKADLDEITALIMETQRNSPSVAQALGSEALNKKYEEMPQGQIETRKTRIAQMPDISDILEE